MTYHAIDPTGKTWEMKSIDDKAFAVLVKLENKAGEWDVFRWTGTRSDAVRGALCAREHGYATVRTVPVQRVA